MADKNNQNDQIIHGTKAGIDFAAGILSLFTTSPNAQLFNSAIDEGFAAGGIKPTDGGDFSHEPIQKLGMTNGVPNGSMPVQKPQK